MCLNYLIKKGPDITVRPFLCARGRTLTGENPAHVRVSGKCIADAAEIWREGVRILSMDRISFFCSESSDGNYNIFCNCKYVV